MKRLGLFILSVGFFASGAFETDHVGLSFDGTVLEAGKQNTLNQALFTAVKNQEPSASIIHWIEEGAKVNSQDEQGHTPLHWAVISGDFYKVKLLLSQGADPHISNHLGHTPFWYIYNLETNNRYEFARILLEEYQFNSNIKDSNDNTPLHILFFQTKKEYKHDFLPAITQLLISHGAYVNAQNNRGETPLHLVRFLNYHDQNTVVPMLLSQGANPLLQNNEGENVFSYLKKFNRWYILYDDVKDETIELIQKYNYFNSHL